MELLVERRTRLPASLAEITLLRIMIASLRHVDDFVKIDGAWYFAERELILDWSETRPSAA